MLWFTDKIESNKALRKISNIGNTIYFAAARRQDFGNKKEEIGRLVEKESKILRQL